MPFDHSFSTDPRDAVHVRRFARHMARIALPIANAIGNEGRVLNIAGNGATLLLPGLSPSAVLAAPCLHYENADALAGALLASIEHAREPAGVAV